MKKYSPLILFLLKPVLMLALLGSTAQGCFAITKSAVLNGYWSNPGIWLPAGVPSSNDSISIFSHVYYDLPVTINSGGRVIINSGASLCGQDSFQILCGGFFFNNGMMSGVYIGVTDGLNNTGSQIFASDTFIAAPCGIGFINNGTTTIGQPYACTITSVNEIKPATDLKIFPNPFSTRLEISAGNKEALEIDVYNIVSQKILHQEFSGSISMDTKQFAEGIYFYEVRSKNGWMQKGKAVKK